MSSARYAPLPNPSTGPDAEREMNEAFLLEEDDDDEQLESTPLTRRHDQRENRPPLAVATQHGTYDFEREYDYDYPPPGSPPDPSIARPNNFGNTNGVLPASPVRPVVNRPSIFRRVAGALLPQHYQRVPSESSARRVGGGIENDGVFANVMAKPARNVEVVGDSGDIHLVPEETQAQAPPSYHEAQADAVPPYWETTIHAPSSLDPNADMIVDDLPTGSWFLFLANVFISWFFQFIGFMFTYLLHTTHAAKYGSRMGLGMTLIQFGFYSRRQAVEEMMANEPTGPSWNDTITMLPGMGSSLDEGGAYGNGTTVEELERMDLSSRDWVSFLLMTLGWFLLLSSLAGFYRVKRWERSIRGASQPAQTHDTESRRATDRMIFPMVFTPRTPAGHEEAAELSEVEVRLTRDLREAGLI
ncbi:hypothetical protein BDW22DRAFT_1352194 [Trametopsis cervina]|nr:hypothetical protein BDW22DRAFT_1352194 [Trametopsis cervina]